MSTRWSRAFLLVSGGLGPLVLGALVYLKTRSTLRLHGWLASFDRGALHAPHGLATHVPAWVKYNLPDGLWQFAFSFVVFALWRGRGTRRERFVWGALPVAIGLGFEIGQGLGIFEGVFDWRDLVASVAGSALAYLAATQAFARHTDDAGILVR